MDDYTYKPLLAGEIRLLRLDPQGSNQLLNGSIIHTPLVNPTYHLEENGTSAYLEHHVTYEAISYHWGRETIKPFQLVVENQTVIRLSTELRAILQMVANPDKEQLVWVDAICINQVDNNSKEKEEQIRLMPDIYRVAARVQVHLGREADNSKLAIEFINQIAENVEHFADPFEIRGAREYQLSRAKGLGLELPPEDDERWLALRAFWRRPWFRRIWVIQECVYATDIVIICGDTQIDWLNLCSAAVAIYKNALLTFSGLKEKNVFKQLPVFRDAYAGVIAFHTIYELRMRTWGYKTSNELLRRLEHLENVPIINLIKTGIRSKTSPFPQDLQATRRFVEQSKPEMFRHRGSGQTFPFGRSDLLMLLVDTNQCLYTHAKDRMYALLGLADDVDYTELAVRYSDDESVEAVCQRFAAKLISNGRCGEILSWAGYISQISTNKRDVPSWVPDWTSPTTNLWDIRPTMCFLMSKHRIGLRHFFKTIGQDPGLEDMHAVAKKYMGEAIAVIEKIEKKGIVLDDQHLGEVIPTLDELVKQESRIYRAALESEVSYQFIDNPATLILKGSRVDSVIKDLAGVLDLAPAFYECFVATNTKYPTGEALQEVIWRTSIANRTSEGRRAPEEYGRQYELLKEQLFGHVVDYLISHPVCWTCIWIFQFVKWTTDKLLWLPMVQLLRCGYFWTSLAVVLLQPELTKLVTFILIAALMATLRFVSFFVLAVALRYPALIWGLFRWSTHFSKKDITFTDPLPQGAAGYSQSLAEARGAYKLGITSMGYIGLLPLATKIGDEVAIFHGCDTPFVIRRSEPAQFYKLIGECYVHGMMQGELFENPRFSIENIAIR